VSLSPKIPCLPPQNCDWLCACNDVTLPRRASGQPADAAASASGRRTCSDVMVTILKVWRSYKIRLQQSTCNHLKNNPVKFHPLPIWNDGAFGFLLKSGARTWTRITTTRWVAVRDQFLIQNILNNVLHRLHGVGSLANRRKKAIR